MKSNKQTADRQVSIAVGAVAAWCFIFFAGLRPYHLFLKEQTQLFLFTAGYARSYAEKPGGLACYAGDFLTQFFYLRGGGGAVLTLVFLLEYVLVRQVLKRLGMHHRAASWTALALAAAETMLHGGAAYGLSMTASILLALLAFLALARLRSGVWLPVVALLLTPCLYVAAGASSFLFCLLAAVYLMRTRQRWRFCGWALVALAAACPPALRHGYLLTAKQAYCYPFAPPGQASPSIGEETLAIATEAYFGRWDEVLRLSRDARPPHPIATYYACIALSKQGRLADELPSLPLTSGEELFLPVGPQSDWLTIFFSSDVFYHLGDMNMAQHAAMLGMIFSPHHRSSRMVKRLAEIHLVNGEAAAARKYLRLLEATLFHRRWAMQASIGLEQKRALIPARDILRTSTAYVPSLELLAESNPASFALDYLLCYHLLNRDVPAFCDAFDRYAQGRRPPARLYSEALLIKLAATHAPAEAIEAYSIAGDVVADFMEYTRLYRQSGGQAEPLPPRFAPTYWFYYHFTQPTK